MNAPVTPYTEIPGFEHVYLEDSFVLGVVASPGRLTFTIDAVLTPEHPHYQPPKQDEHHCYQRGVIVFERVGRLVWEGQGNPPAVDATGEIDYGSIDSMYAQGPLFSLSGEWGKIQVESHTPVLKLNGFEEGT